jgi:alpha-glucosidase
MRVVALDPEGDNERAFTLFEDDGVSVAYQTGAVRTTRIRQQRTSASQLAVVIEAANGTYAGAPASRNAIVEVVPDGIVSAVTLNGTALTRRTSAGDFADNAVGWFDNGNGLALAKSADMSVSTERRFVFEISPHPTCESRFLSVSVPGEGNGWNAADASRALGCVSGRRWEGEVCLERERFKFAANGGWTVNWGSDGRQDGPNFGALAQSGRYRVTFDEANAANPVFARVGDCPARSARFVCENGETTLGTSVYAVGNIDSLGGWNPSQAQLLAPNGPYPTWTGAVAGLPAGQRIEWKCIKRLEGSDQRVIQWEPGDNNAVDFAQPTQVGRF